MFEPNKLLKLEKIFKIFNALDRPESSIFVSRNDLSKADHIEHCTTILQNLCHRSIRSHENFAEYLQQSIRILLALCDHSDIDVRNAANDSLDRICLTYKDTIRLQAQLYSEFDQTIKKRPLTVALKKFADVCYCIRSTKYRPFALKIFTCLIGITKRDDILEIQELVTECLQKICPVLCPYASDKDLISLMNLYIPLLNNDIVSIRRSFALALSTICQTSRRPHQFCQWLITNLLNQLSVVPTDDREMFVSGVFTTFKFLLSKVNALIQQNLDDSIHEFFIEKTIFIYQHLLSSLHYSKNNSVIVSSLETLQELFQNLSPIVLEKILNIDSKLKLSNYSRNDPLYSSNISIDELSHSNQNNVEHFDDFFEQDEEHFHGAKLTGDDFNSLRRPATSSSEYAESVILSDYDDSSSMFQDRSDTDSVYDDCRIEEFDIDKNMKNPHEPNGRSQDFSPSIHSSSDDFSSKSLNDQHDIEFMNLGETYSLEWTCKLICIKFLLKGQKGQLYQSEIRSSIKILALNLFSQIVEYYPQAIHLKFDDDAENKQQNLSDVLLYRDDSDPNIRSATGGIASKLLQSFLHDNSESKLCLEELFKILKCLLQDESGICLKQILISLQCFYADSLKNFEIKGYAKELFPILLDLSANNYWLVKVELINLLSCCCEQLPLIDRDIWMVVLKRIFLKFLFYDDFRVRNAAVNGLITIVQRANLVGSCFLDGENDNEECLIEQELKTFVKNSFNEKSSVEHSIVCKNLSLIVDLLLKNFPQTINSKTQLSASVSVFSCLVRAFPPSQYKDGWLFVDNEWLQVLPFFMDILVNNHFSVLFDIQVHSDLVFLLQELFLAFRETNDRKNDETLSELLASFHVHLMKIIVCYVSIIESNSSYFITYSYILHSTNHLQIRKILQKTKQKSLKDKDSMLYIRRLLLSRGGKKDEAKLYEPIYYKVYEFLRMNFKNFKTFKNENQRSILLSHCLEAFGKLLQFNQINRRFLLYEQILFYFNILFDVEPIKIVFCVKEMLKFVFNYDSIEFSPRTEQCSQEFGKNFYNDVIMKPYFEMNNLYKNIKNSLLENLKNCDDDQDCFSVCSLDCLSKSRSPLAQDSLRDMVFFFEPLVIESLKLYVNSNDKQLQCVCLELLTILVRLRTDFNKLDSNRTLMKCIYKQFDMMENIHDSKLYEELIRELFHFLIILSKNLISNTVEQVDIPKLIQFCDIFIANNHQNLAAIGLEVLAEELFPKYPGTTFGVVSATVYETINENLETEREVLLAYCFKLFHVPKISNILARIVKYYYDDSKTKYEEISNKIFEQIRLKTGSFSFSSTQEFNDFSLLLFSLNHSVSRNQLFLEVIFQHFDMGSISRDLDSIGRFMNFSTYLLFTTSETEILERTKEFFNNQKPAKNNEDSVEMIFVQQFWNIFSIGFKHLNHMKESENREEFQQSQRNHLTFLLTRLSFLMTFIYQSGLFPKLTSASIQMFAAPTTGMNCAVSGLECLLTQAIVRHSLLTISWLNTLFVLKSEQFYPILEQITSASCHKDPVVRRFAIIFRCDFLTEAIEDSSSLIISQTSNKTFDELLECELVSLFENSIQDVIEMCDNQVPVKEFINSVQRHSCPSSLFLKYVDRAFDKTDFKAAFCLKALKCLERIHPSESYSLITFLFKSFIINNRSRVYLGCCKTAENMIISRFELILQEYKVGTRFLSLKGIKNMKAVLKKTPFFKLNNFIDKVLLKLFAKKRPSLVSSKDVPLNDPLNVSFSSDKQTLNDINREWFNELLLGHFSVKQTNQQKSEYFFAKLSAEDITKLMNSEQFHITNHGQIISFVGNSILNQSTELSCINFKSKHNNSSYHLEAKKHLVGSILEWNCEYMKFIVELYQNDRVFPNNPALCEALQLYTTTLTTFVEHLSEFERFTSTTSITDGGLDMTLLQIYSSFVKHLNTNGHDFGAVLALFSAYIFNENLFLKLTNIENFQYYSVLVESTHDLFSSHFETSSNKPKLPERLLESVANKEHRKTMKQLLVLFNQIEHNCHLASSRHLPFSVEYYLEKIVLKLCHSPLVHSLNFIVPYIYEQINYDENRFSGPFRTECQMDNLPALYASDVDALRQLQFRIENLAMNSLEFAGEIWNMLLQTFSIITAQLYDVERSSERTKQDMNDVIEMLVECIRTMTKMIHYSSLFGHVYIEERFFNNLYNRLNHSIIADPRWGQRADFILKFLQQEDNRFTKSSARHKRKNFQARLEPNFKLNHGLRSANFDMFIDSSCPMFMIELFHHQIESMSRENFVPFPVLAEIMRSVTVLVQSLPFGGSECQTSSGRRTAKQDLGKFNDDFSEQLQSQWISSSSWIDRGMALIDDIGRLTEVYEDKIIESLFVMNYVKIFTLISRRNESAQPFSGPNSERIRKNLLDNLSKDFYFPLRIAALKAILIAGNYNDGPFFSDHDGRAIENVIKFNYDHILPNREFESIQWRVINSIFSNRLLNNMINREFQKELLQIMLKNLLKKNCKDVCLALEAFSMMANNQTRTVNRQQQHQQQQPHQRQQAVRHSNAMNPQLFQDQSHPSTVHHQSGESLIYFEDQIKQINEMSLNQLIHCHSASDRMSLLRLYISSLYILTTLGNATNNSSKRSKLIISPIESPTTITSQTITTPYERAISPERISISDNETLFSVMEQLSVIFDLLTNCNTREATLFCQILGHFLVDFFPAQDLLNKCIGQFLSNQQNHYKHLTNVLFVIFNKFQNDFSNTDTAQDWVVLSLASFTQLVPVSHSLWSLTCFFAAASQNHWIRASFPAFRERFGQFDSNDQEQFLIVCNNFFNEIKSLENRGAFIKTFQQASSLLSNSPYFEVLKHLNEL